MNTKETEREDKVKTLRLLQLAEFIRTHHYPNAPKLMDEFEVSRSTIMRDIEFLQTRYNAPIEYSQEHKGYYYTDPTFIIKSVMLSEGELLSVSTIMPLMEQYKNTPLESTFRSIMTKVVDMMPNKVQIDTAFSASNVYFIKDPLPSISEHIFNSVFEAIRANKTVEFEYRSISKKEYSKRSFDPYKVLCQKGNWYIIGFCHLHNRINVYALSRMRNLIVTDEIYTIEKDFDINKHIDPEFGIWHSEGEPKKIELEFSPQINTYILERSWHENQECHQNPDGSVYLSYVSNQITETLHWIMSFGANVKVLNPPELIEKIKSEIQKLNSLY